MLTQRLKAIGRLRGTALLALLSVAMIVTAPAHGQDKKAAAAPATITTVFVDANFGARKGGAAKQLNEKHAEMAVQGWKFAGLAPYTENGDLVGFFVTYVR
jgi:hypothetical protein